MEDLILVIYIGVQGVRTEDIPEFVQKVTKRISPTTFEGEIITIPTQSPDTRMECINPVYITKKGLITKHTNMMNELKEHLQHQLKQIKDKSNE